MFLANIPLLKLKTNQFSIIIITCSNAIWQQSNVIRPIPTIMDDTSLSKRIINGQDGIWNGFYCQSRSRTATSNTVISHHQRWCKMSPLVTNKPSNCCVWTLGWNILYIMNRINDWIRLKRLIAGYERLGISLSILKKYSKNIHDVKNRLSCLITTIE